MRLCPLPYFVEAGVSQIDWRLLAQGSQRRGLAPQAVLPAGRPRRAGQHLDRHRAAEIALATAVDDALTAAGRNQLYPVEWGLTTGDEMCMALVGIITPPIDITSLF